MYELFGVFKISRRPSHPTATLQFATATSSLVHYKVNIYSAHIIKCPQRWEGTCTSVKTPTHGNATPTTKCFENTGLIH
jgi:hypothetical protein